MAPADVDPALAPAVQFHRAGKLQEAEQAYQEILARRPEYAPALHLMGILAGQTRRAEMAVEMLGRAVALDPSHPEYHNNLGNALVMMGRHAEAIASFEQTIKLQPGISEAHRNLAIALNVTGNREAAIAEFQKAITLQPGNIAAILNLGNLYQTMGRPDDALEQFRSALRMKPDFAMAINNLAMVLASQRNVHEAIELYRRAFTVNPDYALAQSNLIYTMHLDPQTSDADLQRELSLWSSRFAAPLAKGIAPHQNGRDPRRKLRVGYVSADFREHPVGRFMVDILASHNKQQFEIHCYSDAPVPDAMTERLKAKADRWHAVNGMPDAELAELVRASEIDLLVDLTAHTAGSRLRMFARKPAPVQVTYLAYCSTTGIKAMDYRLSDARLDPPETVTPYYAEETVYLPETYWCYSSPPEAPDPNALPLRTNGHVTLGCLNSLSKVSDQTLQAWAEIIKKLPTSRLLLYAAAGSHRRKVSDQLAAMGVEAGRVEFVPYQPLGEYFRTLQRMDLALDPFPFAGGTTTCDALFMGVPVVTLRGGRAVGRGGVSILTSLSLLELIAGSVEQYVQIAVRLAKDGRALKRYRGALRAMMLKSGMMSPERFTRHLEAAYRRMWTTWCARNPK